MNPVKTVKKHKESHLDSTMIHTLRRAAALRRKWSEGGAIAPGLDHLH